MVIFLGSSARPGLALHACHAVAPPSGHVPFCPPAGSSPHQGSALDIQPSVGATLGSLPTRFFFSFLFEHAVCPHPASRPHEQEAPVMSCGGPSPVMSAPGVGLAFCSLPNVTASLQGHALHAFLSESSTRVARVEIPFAGSSDLVLDWSLVVDSTMWATHQLPMDRKWMLD